MLQTVRNRRLYRLYLSSVVTELFALLDLAWAQNPPTFDVPLSHTAGVHLHILMNLPPGTEKLRLSILVRLEAGLAAEAKARAGGNGRPGGAPGEGNQAADSSRGPSGPGGSAPGGQPAGSVGLIDELGTRNRE